MCKFNHISFIMSNMKKIFLGLAAALMLTACNENRQPEATTSVDSASVVTDLMMSRRSIRAYKDSAYDTTYDMAQIDCGLLGENIILAAWAKGIGSCCLGSSARWILDSPSAKPYLDRMAFSKGYKLLYCIALGYPDESPEAKPRRQDMIKFMD